MNLFTVINDKPLHSCICSKLLNLVKYKNIITQDPERN